MSERARFVVTFTPASGANGVRSLRLLLKAARRRYGLLAVDAYEDRHHVSELRTVAGADGGRTRGAPKRESTKMDMSKSASTKFLKAADVRESGTFRATIVEVEEGKKFNRPNLTLDDGSTLSANATSCDRLLRAYGAESDDWLDKEIEVYAEEVEIKDKNTGEMKKTDAVFINPISPPLEKEKKAAVKPPKDNSLEDEIPF